MRPERLILDRTHRCLVGVDGRDPGFPLPSPAGNWRDADGKLALAYIVDEPRAVAGAEWVPLARLDDGRWRIYCETMLGGYVPRKRDLDVFAFGNTPEMAARLAHLVIKGVKRVTAGFPEIMRKLDLTIPTVGLMSVVTDYYGVPLAIIETVEVRHTPFNEVKEDAAIGEGEGDLTYDYWRRVHWDYFRKEAHTYGLTFTETSIIVSEFFRVVKVLKREPALDGVEEDVRRLAQAQLDAYNAQDVDAFVACYSDDVEVRMLGDEKIATLGRAAFRQQYVDLFKRFPKNHCELTKRIVTGRFAFDQEIVTGRGPDVGTVHATAIYEIRGQGPSARIAKVWFARG